MPQDKGREVVINDKKYNWIIYTDAGECYYEVLALEVGYYLLDEDCLYFMRLKNATAHPHNPLDKESGWKLLEANIISDIDILELIKKQEKKLTK